MFSEDTKKEKKQETEKPEDTVINSPIISLESGSTEKIEPDKFSVASKEDYKKIIETQIKKQYPILGEKLQEIILSLTRKYVDEELEKLKKQIKDTNENAINAKKELEDKIENHKLTIIETLGIFVALFTFISVDFQVFRSYRNTFAISGLSMILLGTVSFLLIMFDFYILQARAINNRTKISYKNKNIFSGLLERTKNHPTRFGICLFTACFIIIGLVLFHFAQNEDFEDMKNNFKKETGDSIKNDLRMETSLILENQKNIDDRRYYDFKKNYYDDLKKCILNFGFSYRCFKE